MKNYVDKNISAKTLTQVFKKCLKNLEKCIWKFLFMYVEPRVLILNLNLLILICDSIFNLLSLELRSHCHIWG